jgi:hypothetical protein
LLKSEMETNFRILPIYFFFGIQNVRVGGKILGSVGRPETNICFFCLIRNEELPVVAMFVDGLGNNFLHFLVHLIDVWNQKHCTAFQIINKL